MTNASSAPIFKIAFFDYKSYDKDSFELAFSKAPSSIKERLQISYIAARLDVTTAALAKDHQAVCAFVNDDLSAPVVAELKKLGIVVVLMRCAGFDRVDLKACNEAGISVTRVPAYSPYAVAEFAMSLVMTLNRKIHIGYGRTRDGNFELSGLVGRDIHGKTAGVVGTGKIGQCLINILVGFGCKVLAYDVFQSEAVKNTPNVKYVSLDEIWAESDIVSLHVPLMESTKKLINREVLAKMKKGAIIVNTSRGGLIDTQAVIDALVDGQLGGVALDVYENEAEYFFRDCSHRELKDPILARISNMRNAILVSHMAFLTEEALDAIASTTLLNASEALLDGKRFERLTNNVPAA